MVLELPPAGPDSSLFGQIEDAWELIVAEVGPSGLDKGKGGKFLLIPPDYKGPVPPGHIHVPSPTYRLSFAFRSIPAPGKTAADAYQYAKKLRMYFLSEAANPPEQKFYDPLNDRYPTLPYYDERAFQDIYDIVNVEPVKEQDKVMRHTYRAWLDESGAPLGVQQKLMRHAHISTTMDHYGNASIEAKRKANQPVIQRVLKRSANANFNPIKKGNSEPVSPDWTVLDSDFTLTLHPNHMIALVAGGGFEPPTFGL